MSNRPVESMKKDESNLQEFINQAGRDKGAHFLYIFSEQEQYIKNAVEYISEGIKQNHNIILVENDNFLADVTSRLYKKGYTATDLQKITTVDNEGLYNSEQDFHAEESFHNLQRLLVPFIANGAVTRIWGQVKVHESFVSELKEYECDCDDMTASQKVISVCSYNGLETPSFVQNELLKAHKYWMMDDMVMESPLYYRENSQIVTACKSSSIDQDYRDMKEKNNQLILENQSGQKRECSLQTEKLQAEEASYLKNLYLSQMSHDLRTPLNSISGFTQLLMEDEQLSERNKSILHRISNSSEDLLALINDILNVSDLGKSKKVTENIKSLQVHSFLHECVAAFSFTENPSLDIHIQPVKENIYMEAEEMYLKQILNNLLINAIKYNTAEGKIDIYTEFDDGRDQLVLFVEDTGIGLPEEEIQLLFKPYYRSARNMEQWQGTGLGLAIVANLTDKMHGSYGAFNNREEGATFWVSFPAKQHRRNQ